MLDWTGERFIPGEGGPEIFYEHAHRYQFATRFVATKRVLDLGSGEGYGSAWLARYAASVTGVDISPDAVRHATSTYGSGAGPRFVVGDVRALPLADDAVDVVVCFEALEHIVEQEVLVAEVDRVLRADGLFIVSTPDKAQYHDAAEHHNEFHEKELYLDEFRALLRPRFPALALHGQRVVTGSMLWSLEGGDRGDAMVATDPATEPEAGLESLSPVYMIAFCGRTAADLPDTLPNISTLVDADPHALGEPVRRLTAAHASEIEAAREYQVGVEVALEAARERYDHDIGVARDHQTDLQRGWDNERDARIETERRVHDLEATLATQHARLDVLEQERADLERQPLVRATRKIQRLTDRP
jgi:O-antigen biosynthesis protein